MTFDRLLLPTDLSDTAAEPVRHARLLAEHFGAALHVLYVATDVEQQRTAEADVEAFARAHDLAGATPAVVTAEAPAPGIDAYAEEHAIDLIVMGSHGRRGLERLFLGSVTEEVLRKAACPVLTIRTNLDATAQLPVDSVLAPLDLSDASLQALPVARTFAAAYDARLDVLHVVEDIDLPAIYGEDIPNPLYEMFPEVQRRTRAEIDRALAAAPGPEVPTAVHFAQGHAADAIVDFAEDEGVDLIVLTRTGRRGLTRFLIGSATDGVVRTAPCPVLVVPVAGD
jgi:nucleotide-binding universal stress UspA family protein